MCLCTSVNCHFEPQKINKIEYYKNEWGGMISKERFEYDPCSASEKDPVLLLSSFLCLNMFSKEDLMLIPLYLKPYLKCKPINKDECKKLCFLYYCYQFYQIQILLKKEEESLYSYKKEWEESSSYNKPIWMEWIKNFQTNLEMLKNQQAHILDCIQQINQNEINNVPTCLKTQFPHWF